MAQELLLIAARNYSDSFPDERNTAYNSFIHGALWQREQDAKCMKPPPTDYIKLSKEHAADVHNS